MIPPKLFDIFSPVWDAQKSFLYTAFFYVFFSFAQVGELDPPIAHTKGPVDRETLVVQSPTPSVNLQDRKSILSDCLHSYFHIANNAGRRNRPYVRCRTFEKHLGHY